MKLPVYTVTALTFCATFIICEGCTFPFEQHQINGEGFCIFKANETMKYCAAQEFCHSKKGEMVQGDTAMALQQQNPIGNWGNAFVGITDMLDEKGADRDGWRWTDGSITPNGILKNTNLEEVKDCVRTATTSKGILSTNCHNLKAVLCQPLNPDKIDIAVKVFYPRAKRPGKSRQDIPCSQEIHADVKNICALECYKMSECVSFYYKTPDNVYDKNCLLIKYTDGTLDQESEDKYTSRFSTQTSP